MAGNFDNQLRGGLSASRLFGIAIIVGVILLARETFVIVESGHVGVVRTLGAVQPASLAEGFHLKKPILDRVVQIDIRLTKAESAAQAASKDLQTVSTNVTVQYSLDGTVAPKTYQKIGVRRAVASTLVNPAIMESVKSVTAQYTAEELITKRALVKVAIQNEIMGFINTTLEEKDVANALSIANVAITDFDFSAEFNKAIEQKVRAEQEALKAENDKIRRVTQAEASAAERNLAAGAEAYAIEIESKARAEAIRREAAALKNNPELIQLRLAEKWDGMLPKVSGDGAIPLINMDALDRRK
ncbi:MAG: prohibitin family protein [Pseudomonadales bacterium]|nr:prohibitin family protein [Pseudomonadales bacterium]